MVEPNIITTFIHTANDYKIIIIIIIVEVFIIILNGINLLKYQLVKLIFNIY